MLPRKPGMYVVEFVNPTRIRIAISVYVSADSPAANPAFDVTPAALISAIVTEDGVHRAPYAFAATVAA